MFWISYSVTFVLASAIATALMTIRLVLSSARKVFGLIPQLNQGDATSSVGVVCARSRGWSRSIGIVD